MHRLQLQGSDAALRHRVGAVAVAPTLEVAGGGVGNRRGDDVVEGLRAAGELVQPVEEHLPGVNGGGHRPRKARRAAIQDTI